MRWWSKLKTREVWVGLRNVPDPNLPSFFSPPPLSRGFFFPPCFTNRTAGTDYFSRVSWCLTVTLYVVTVGYWFVLVFFYRSLFQTSCDFSCCLFLCFFVFNWSLDLFDAISTLQMLTNIENRLEELFEQIEVMPPDRVEMAEKVRDLFRTTIVGTQ